MKRIYLKSIKSTNDYAEQIAHGVFENTLIITDNQTDGRGQFDRKWFSEPGKSLTISFLLMNKAGDKKIQQDALARVPYILNTAINKIYKIDSRVVLPNDLKIGNKKFCGILIETHYELNILKYAILGIGINVNNDVFSNDIAKIATSIKIETGREVDVDTLINKLEECVGELYV